MRKLVLAAALLATTAAQSAFALDPRTAVKVRALEKITGQATDIEIDVGDTAQFGGLALTVRACYQSPPEEQPPEAAAFLEVISTGVNSEGHPQDDDPRLFSGWMFASSPGLNALEHPLYDVWVISCNAALPESTENSLGLYDESGLGFDSPEESPSSGESSNLPDIGAETE